MRPDEYEAMLPPKERRGKGDVPTATLLAADNSLPEDSFGLQSGHGSMRATPPMGVSGVPVAGPGALTPFNSAYGMEALATDEDGKPFGNLIASAEAAMEEKDALKSVAAEAAAKPPPPPQPKVEEAKAEAEAAPGGDRGA